MSTLFFWKEWNKTDRVLYLSYLFIFISAFLMLAYAFAYGRSEVIQLGQHNEPAAIKTIIAKSQYNTHDYNVEANQYIVSEQYTTAPLKINPVYSYIYLAMIMLAMIMILTIITYLDLLYYLGAMTIFLLYLAYMQTELLGIFGMNNKNFLIALIIAYGIPSFLLRSYSEHKGILRRLLIFIAITIAFLACVYAGSNHIKTPLLFLPNFGIILPICITVVFLIMIGFDMIKAFLHMVSTGRAEQKKNSLPNFLIISGLYILSVLLTFLKKSLYIDWDIIYINAFLFYSAAAIYGIWAYKKRNVLFVNVLPFRPLGALFYLSLGIVSTATMAYAFIMANDPLAEAFERAILYTQLCMSIIFVVYILINFYRFFATNLNIFEVVYKPNSMPFFMVRGIGIMAVVSLYWYFNQFPLRLAQAGYYNAAGDVYYIEKDTVLAKQYYYKGFTFEPQNIRSSYGLALLYEQDGQKALTQVFYENALSKHKHIESFLGLSNMYYSNEQWFNAMFTLKDGLEYFPNSSELNNNLGIVYNKLNIKDSALYYFQRAYEFRRSDQSAPITNLLYHSLKSGNTEEATKLIPVAEKFPDNISLNTNPSALKSINGEKVSNTNFKLDAHGKMNTELFYLDNNYILNHLGEKDTAILTALDSMHNDPALAGIRDNLNWLRGLSYYYSGEKIKGIEIMMNLHISAGSPIYTNTIANWMLNEQATSQSAYFYSSLMQYGDQSSALNYALVSALSQTNDTGYLVLLDSLTSSKNQAIQTEARDHLTALRASSYETLTDSTEKVRYLYLHYHAIDELLQQIYIFFF